MGWMINDELTDLAGLVDEIVAGSVLLKLIWQFCLHMILLLVETVE